MYDLPNMNRLLVDEIEVDGNVTRGYVVSPAYIMANLHTIHTDEEIEQNIGIVRRSPLGRGNYMTRYCQFIVLVNIEFEPKENLTMVIIDCHNDLDAALDEYLKYKSIEWSSRDWFMELFGRIRDEIDCPKAEMKVLD